jgi:hypothetical protein
MESIEKEKNVIEIIKKAFQTVTRENGTSLHEADVIDGYGSEEEQKEARKLDKDTHWSEILDEDIKKFPSILSFLNPVGWRYHIPAYMIWTIKNYKNSDSFTVDSTIYDFILQEEKYLNWCMERFSLLTQEQSRAVAMFLKYMAEDERYCDAPAAKEALDKYWIKFLED